MLVGRHYRFYCNVTISNYPYVPVYSFFVLWCLNKSFFSLVDLLEANPHYALIKDQRGNTKTVSTQDLAPYPRQEAQNTRREQLQDFDELASEAANS